MKVKSFFVSGSGMIGAQMIALLSLPFLTRLYEPYAYAQWAAVQAAVLFIGAIASLRYDLAIVVERDRTTASALFWIALLAGLFIASLAVAALLIMDFGNFAEKVGIADSLEMAITIIWLAGAAVSPALIGWCLRAGRFGVIAAAQIAIAATTLAVQLGGGLLSGEHADWQWLLAGSTVGQVAGLLVVSGTLLKKDDRPTAFGAVRYAMVSAGRKHLNFLRFSLPFTIFGAVRDRSPLFIVGSWTSVQDMGLYSQAWRLSNVPAALTGAVVRPVLFQASATEGLGPLEKTINRILFLQVLAGAPLLAVVLAYPTEILGWVLGDRWKDIGPIIAPLLVPAFVFSISNWMDRLLDSAGRQDLNLITEIISGATSVAALICTFSLGFDIHAAVVAQSAVLTFNYIAFIYLVYTIAGYNRLKFISLTIMAMTIFALTFGITKGLIA